MADPNPHRMNLSVGGRVHFANSADGPRATLEFIRQSLLQEAIERDSARLLTLAELLEDHTAPPPGRDAMTRARRAVGVRPTDLHLQPAPAESLPVGLGEPVP